MSSEPAKIAPPVHAPLSPNAFLRARRPERFSDTTVVEDQPLDRSILEYHLSTLTNRSQENEFESFARRLLEREVCPNLLPHTGPTGGGDSKVDSETFPVADDLASTWYVGVGRKAAEERWAFAFSTKKEWRTKCRSDVKKIAGTKRGYAKAFFVTSQFVPDKARAEVETELSTAHGLDVRIFDRNWILERVYAGKHQQLATDELHLQVAVRVEAVKGPSDVRREKQLLAVDARVEERSRSGRLGPVFVQDLLKSALIARSLERPRAELDGRFGRARDAAEKHGTHHQQVVVAYQDAFTAFWWFEDYTAFHSKLAAFEPLVSGARNAYHLELATSLWMALYMGVKGELLDATEARLGERGAVLTAALDAAAGRDDQPSTAHHAECLAIQVRLLDAPAEARDELLKKLKAVIERSAGLLGFPLAAVVESINALGAVLGESPAFDELYATAVRTVSTRDGEIAGARLLVRRGTQQLDEGNSYAAIRTLGQALARLYKEESVPDLLGALYSLGAAYERVGLLWAARGSLLVAASIATGIPHQSEVVSPLQAACYDHIRWIELRLGRVPHLLAWHEVTRAAKAALAQRGMDPARLARGDRDYDGILGMLLLRTSVWDLRRYSRLVGTLENLGLPWAALALKFALGHEDEVRKELTAGGVESSDLNEFFSLLAKQPAAEDLPPAPVSYSGRTETIVSRVLGCEIRIETDTSSPCIELAESIAAATESFLATGVGSRKAVISRVPTVTLRIRGREFSEAPFEFESDLASAVPHFEVSVPPWNPHAVSHKDQKTLKDKLGDLIASLAGYAIYFDDYEESLLRLIRDERALERALHFTGSFVTIANVLGDKPKHSLDDWMTPQDIAHPLRRSETWNPKPPVVSAAAPSPDASGSGSHDGASEAARSEWNEAKHTDIRTISLIAVPLWERAKWSATVFMTVKDDPEPPAIAPVFRDKGAAEEIFTTWRKTLGSTDEEDRIRVLIVRGIDAGHPHAYRIVIGADMEAALTGADAPKYVVTLFRVCRMDAESPVNLDRFLASYAKCGAYDLLPAYSPAGPVNPILARRSLWIRKRKLRVVRAWEIGVGDIDSAAIVPGDTPVIPSGREADAPVLELLEKLRSN